MLNVDLRYYGLSRRDYSSFVITAGFPDGRVEIVALVDGEEAAKLFIENCKSVHSSSGRYKNCNWGYIGYSVWGLPSIK